MKRALTVNNILNKKRRYIKWGAEASEFEAAFGKPESCGVWFVWAKSGNGKSSFIMRLIKALAPNGAIIYNAKEEGDSDSFRKKLLEHKINQMKQKVLFVQEDMPELEARLDKRNSAKIVVIDSVQYVDLSYKEYKRIKEKYPDKIFILVSHEEGKMPAGRSAVKMQFDAYMKIRVEGYKAFCKGREIGSNGGVFTIWEDGAKKYWGEVA